MTQTNDTAFVLLSRITQSIGRIYLFVECDVEEVCDSTLRVSGRQTTKCTVNYGYVYYFESI